MTKRTNLLIVLLLLASAAFLFLQTVESVAVRTWIVASPGEPLPEIADPELSVPWLTDRPSFGVAFSGGGTRSASATLGQLRALKELGWLNHARYLSANSGGSWVTVPYTWLPATISDEKFLGDYIPPHALRDANLRPDVSDPLAFETAIHDATTFDELHEIGRGDEAYSDIVASIFLEPFGLHDNEKFFTFHPAALDRVLENNPGLSANRFQTIEHVGRPYPIVTGVMIGQQLSDNPEEYFPVDMTPLYTGVRGRFEFEKDGETVVVGGGYVESFGYDSYEPRGNAVDDRWRVRLTGMLVRGDKPFGDRYRFTLSDVIGTSSAAPLGTLSRYSVPNFLFPEFRHWSVDQNAIRESAAHVRRFADEFQHGDGADMDNLALTPLLVRKTENIIVFVNTEDRFRKPATGCQNVTEEHISDDIVSYFRHTGVLVHNIVFDDGQAGLAAICEAFAEQRATGQPLVYCQAYDVQANARHGIAPYRSSICWVYLDRSQNWIDQLETEENELVAELANNEDSFENFPHYRTFAEQGVSLIDLNRERVVALSNLAAWVVNERAQYIAGHLSGAELPAP